MVRHREQRQTGRGQPRVRDPALDDVPGRGVGFSGARHNPSVGIRKNPRRNIARFLDTAELAQLGKALDAHEARWPEAVAAIRLLALTGCRRGEVLNLRWRDIGENAIVLSDSKTGPRSMPLGEAARAIVGALPGPQTKDALLFPKNAGRRNPHNIVACWRTVCDDAKLGKVRLHDLRHYIGTLTMSCSWVFSRDFRYVRAATAT